MAQVAAVKSALAIPALANNEARMRRATSSPLALPAQVLTNGNVRSAGGLLAEICFAST